MSDIIFDTSEQITVACDNLKVQGHDFLLDSVERRIPNGPTFRRAFVHDQSDGLTINFNHDYPGGVTLNGPVKISENIEFTITHDDELVINGPHGGHPPTETVMLADVIKSLRREIADLTNRIKKLEGGA